MEKSSLKIAILLIVGVVIGLAFYGYFEAVPASIDQTGDRPQIEISPLFYDFGKIEYGQVVKYTFKIKNNGTEILEIKRVATSCGCTTAKVAKNNLEPNEEIDLDVEYDTGAMAGSHAQGQQERIIYVKSNDPVNPQVEVMIYANVK